MKNCKLVSLILIFIGTLGFVFGMLANSILVANNLLIIGNVEALGIFKFNSVVQGLAFVLLFAGIVMLVTEFVLNVKNNKKD
ncbi:MAG: hypothetical protein IJW82_08350 [Clostridia bacterium]|nr:hypothetical protein [Clostridia bacterium]